MKKIKILITRKRIIREFAEEMARLQKRADKYYYINKDQKMSDFILNYASEIKDFSKRLGICNEMYQEAYKIYDFTRSGNKDYTPSKEVLEKLLKRYKELEEKNKKYKRLANKNLENEIILREKNAPEDIYVLQSKIEELEEVVNKYGGEQELEKYITELSRYLGNVSIDAMLGTIKREFIPISVIQNKIDELNRRIDYLNTELNKCYIEREKLGTETDIDNNETAIFCMEQEREYRYEQKQVLQELLEERIK